MGKELLALTVPGYAEQRNFRTKRLFTPKNSRRQKLYFFGNGLQIIFANGSAVAHLVSARVESVNRSTPALFVENIAEI